MVVKLHLLVQLVTLDVPHIYFHQVADLILVRIGIIVDLSDGHINFFF